MNAPDSSRRLVRPCTWVFLGLVLLTLVTWAVGTLGLSGLWFSLFLLLLALLKGGAGRRLVHGAARGARSMALGGDYLAGIAGFVDRDRIHSDLSRLS